ncbi:XRE family transcriptional regulator [Streptomyces sp. NPDC059740]|uniref:XRE family transcriptional regulator n=1 Tax=Streptomyces sp. NPDC059740 TaxID=3346926 RepID=UPI00366496BB
MSTPHGDSPGPSAFDAGAARRLRLALRMTPAQVAHGMWAAYGLRVLPSTVESWEAARSLPDRRELLALAGALWCAPGDLLGEPRTLREHRTARGVAASDVALRLGMSAAAYERVEAEGRWTGDARQAVLLGEILGLGLPTLVELTGRGEQLEKLLRYAATTRWQAYVKPVRTMLALEQERVREALEHLHDEYHRRTVATAHWGGGSSAGEAARAGREYLSEVRRHFWERLGMGAG